MAQRDRSPQSSPLHLFISTGEVSGDLQGSYLVQALRRQAQHLGITLRITALGGQRMAAEGVELISDTTAIGSVGIFEAIPHILPTLSVQRRVKAFLRQQPVDFAIFIDYMGPNLNLGQFLRQRYPDLPTAYYIAPQQWAWAFSEKDTQALVQMSDTMVAVFPQEAEYYRKFGAKTVYHGHPLVDTLATTCDREAARKQLGLAPDAPVMTLLPASRQQEVKYILPLMVAVAERIQQDWPDMQFLVPVSMEKLRSQIASTLAQSSLQARVIDQHNHLAIAAADLVLNKSGTVNLEVALMNVPQIVIYRLNPVTARVVYYLLKMRLDYISPVNLLMNRPVVPEFVQWEATVDAITAASLALLKDTNARQTMLEGYADLHDRMGQPGVCDRVAAYLLDFAIARKQAHAPSKA